MSSISVFNPVLAKQAKDRQLGGQLYGSALPLLVANAARQHSAPLLLVAPDSRSATQLQQEIRFFLNDEADCPTLFFPDWETLPYDHFSPHQDIISERLTALNRIPLLNKGVIIAPAATLMHRLPPTHYLHGRSLQLVAGQKLDLENMRLRLEKGGYRLVNQVMEHGEFAVRGSLLDIFPMGCKAPFRIELFDDEIDSLRLFDAESQRTIEKVEQIDLLPAREFPLDDEGIKLFRQNYREQFSGDPKNSLIYRDVSNGLAPAGIEYYLPLFFEQTDTIFDYLPKDSLIAWMSGVEQAAEEFLLEVKQRHEQLQGNYERPLLAPEQLFLPLDNFHARSNEFPRCQWQNYEIESKAGRSNYATAQAPQLSLQPRAEQPTAALQNFIHEMTPGRVLLAAESAGHREVLQEMLRGLNYAPRLYQSWPEFVQDDAPLGLIIAPLEQGMLLQEPRLAVIVEAQLYGEKVMQRRRRQKAKGKNVENMLSNLAELTVGSPVVHEEHGVGRYLGLQRISLGANDNEYLTLEYAAGDKLYVPVSALHLISRYNGAAPDKAPLHRLGSGQWEKAKRKAREKVRDVAAELLAIYAAREARQGRACTFDALQYRAFADSFPFEETPDQQVAIEAVVEDLVQGKPMDRLVCGDVGFGKTEVAMRAAFVAVMAGRQVAILVPTTLLAQQHFENFSDRFADWPVKVGELSRFRSKKEQNATIQGLAEGTVDIVIGTHKLIQGDMQYKNLGLVIIDEEHRFGVRQKEQFKKLRAQVDILTLTATPIPRTLNMAVSGMRELSIIASPPARRIAVKTFVSQWDKGQIKEACHRELKRGGQVFFLHNEVTSIERMAEELEDLIPEAKVGIAHGQMREKELEHIMADFYHQRFNLLVCTTIIENGIDVPTANTIIINRADKFGLAQLYQLRGRVGRSHHRAYAYLITPPRKSLTRDAKKRLDAIESIEDLGTGFTLATHDLEIRGAGELLGDEQSGQINEVGFSLYTEMLEKAVRSIRNGEEIGWEQDSDGQRIEVEASFPALIPDDYLPDVHNRLMMYKRISGAVDFDALQELQVESIDRFGLLPPPLENLFQLSRLKISAKPLGVTKLELGLSQTRVTFKDEPPFNPMAIILLLQTNGKTYQMDKQQRVKILHQAKESKPVFEQVEKFIQHLSKHLE